MNSLNPFSKSLALKNKTIFISNKDDTKTISVEINIKSDHELDRYQAEQLTNYFLNYPMPQNYYKKEPK